MSWKVRSNSKQRQRRKLLQRTVRRQSKLKLRTDMAEAIALVGNKSFGESWDEVLGRR
jgi:hypothetical protein